MRAFDRNLQEILIPEPRTGETLLPGWGTRVSMERRLWVATEDECLTWAATRWQLELVAKARHYPESWAVNTLRNRAMGAEVYDAREEGRAPELEQFKRGGRWQPPESVAPPHVVVTEHPLFSSLPAQSAWVTERKPG
jgi:hypothetical protein